MEVIDRWGCQGRSMLLKKEEGQFWFGEESPTTGQHFCSLPTPAFQIAFTRLEHWKNSAERERLQLETERQANVASEAKLQRENDKLARGVLDLTRRLTIAEQRTKHAEELAERAMADAGRWRRSGLEGEDAELWRLSYMTLPAEFQKLTRRVQQELGEKAAGGHLLPLAYFPAGEEPGARWGLTDLGQQAVDSGRVKGPEWTLLVSPEPREILSIEVRSGSRQETIYRAAGYVSAEDPNIQGGHFLGLLEAFAQVAAAEDEVMGRAMKALESLYLFEQQHLGAQALEAAETAMDTVLGLMGESDDHPEASACAYDLAAVCARCSRPYGEHVLPAGPVECDGFLAEVAP
jgi:hypothetical protein